MANQSSLVFNREVRRETFNLPFFKYSTEIVEVQFVFIMHCAAMRLTLMLPQSRRCRASRYSDSSHQFLGLRLRRRCAVAPITKIIIMLVNIAHVDSVGTVAKGTVPTVSVACAGAMLFPFVVTSSPAFNVLT